MVSWFWIEVGFCELLSEPVDHVVHMVIFLFVLMGVRMHLALIL